MMALRRRKLRPSQLAALAAERAATPPRLAIELVPATCWCVNVRSAITGAEWDLIRRRVYRRASYRCEVCGGRGPEHPVECHEVWDYDDTQLLQRLEGMIALCPACHWVKHFGSSQIRGHDQEAFAQLMAVNDWTPAQAEQHVAEVFELWQWRSDRMWDLDLTVLAKYGIEPLPNHDGYVFAADEIGAGVTIRPLTDADRKQTVRSLEAGR
jgi:5-methylcytosine-specific restriction endonuclease McrA